jgi:UDP-glucose 4-epimerase
MKDKLILVTGGAGFVGSHLCERLVAEGAHVISLDNYFTGSRENHVPGVEYREGHTKDIEQLISERPDIVFHLGEYSRVEKSFEDVEQVWDLNQFGTFAVLEFARRRGAKLIYAGSSTKFGDNGLGRDQSPYAWSKASMTDLVRNYGEWFGLTYAITYFYNVYGPRESSSAFGTVVAIFRDQYTRGVPRTVVAPGTQERIFTHVGDIVNGLLHVGEKGIGDGFGIGGKDKLTILELAHLFGDDVLMLPERAGNRKVAAIDTSKTEALGWSATHSLHTYIQEFLDITKPAPAPQPRILVFSTTFYPVMGPAENALVALAKKLPRIQFDVIAGAHTKSSFSAESPAENITMHFVGSGTRFDKYLLPILGRAKAFALASQYSYLFAWSLMASYGVLPAVALRKRAHTPLLVTLSDQQLSWHERFLLRFILAQADQVYTSIPEQVRSIVSLEERMRARSSLGSGDALANQIRFTYSQLLMEERRENN